VLGQLCALKWLLQHTACSLQDTDHEGCTVLHLAARYDFTHCLTLTYVSHSRRRGRRTKDVV